MKVNNLLEIKGREVYKIKDSDTISTALELLAKHDLGALLVMDRNDKIVGVFSERDFARKVTLEGKIPKNTKVKDMMSTTVYFVKPENNLWDCLDIMSKKRTRHLPVIENKELVGIVSIGDIVNRIITEQKSTIENLESYIVGSDYGATIKMPS
jgi:CBS domain-containing protein